MLVSTDGNALKRARRLASNAKTSLPCISCFAYGSRCKQGRPCSRCTKLSKVCLPTKVLTDFSEKRFAETETEFAFAVPMPYNRGDGISRPVAISRPSDLLSARHRCSESALTEPGVAGSFLRNTGYLEMRAEKEKILSWVATVEASANGGVEALQESMCNRTLLNEGVEGSMCFRTAQSRLSIGRIISSTTAVALVGLHAEAERISVRNLVHDEDSEPAASVGHCEEGSQNRWP